MSDWAMYELEDIVWDEFGETDDHIVPHPSGEQGDSHKKPRHEAANAFGRSPDNKKLGSSFHGKDGCPPMLDRGSWSEPLDSEFSALYNIACSDKAPILASKETKLTDNCFQTGCPQDALTENNLCHFSPSGLSPTDSDIEFLGNGDEDKESNNLLDYGWPDIGNFEDVDRMFRNCDSTFGQGVICTAEEKEIACASSSQLVAGHEDVKPGFSTASSETGESKRKSKQYDANTEFIPYENPAVPTGQDKETESSTYPTDSWTSDRNEPSRINHCTLANQLDADSENKGESARKEQVIVQRPPLKSRSQIGGNKGQPPEYLIGTSLLGTSPMKQFSYVNLHMPASASLPVFPSPAIAQTKQFWGPDSFRYMHAHIPYMPVGYSYSPHQIPVAPAMSSFKDENLSQPAHSCSVSAHSSKAPSMTPQEKIKKLRKRQQSRAAFTIEQPHFLSESVLTRCQIQNHPQDIEDEVGVDNEVEGMSVLSVVAADSSTVQESSCISSMLSGKLSPEEISFHQLQDVAAKLDIRTKLCIRDSLYRLARSAEQRHKLGGVSSSCTEGRERNAALVTEELYSHDRLQPNRLTLNLTLKSLVSQISGVSTFLPF